MASTRRNGSNGKKNSRNHGRNGGSRSSYTAPSTSPARTSRTAVETKPIRTEITGQTIAEAAYFLWLQRGGNDVVNWLEAERMLREGKAPARAR